MSGCHDDVVSDSTATIFRELSMTYVFGFNETEQETFYDVILVVQNSCHLPLGPAVCQEGQPSKREILVPIDNPANSPNIPITPHKDRLKEIKVRVCQAGGPSLQCDTHFFMI